MEQSGMSQAQLANRARQPTIDHDGNYRGRFIGTDSYIRTANLRPHMGGWGSKRGGRRGLGKKSEGPSPRAIACLRDIYAAMGGKKRRYVRRGRS